MLERLAAYFLNTYVAEYVGNVVTEQLTIGWLGDVELEKLPLKKNALHKHQLPFDIVSGLIGKLRLQIPVRYIKSQPWVVQVDQVYVILGPSHPDKYDEGEEERKAQERKMAQLARLEQQWREEQRERTGGGWWFLSPLSLSLPSNIITNLQVIINDVHVRYEDSTLGVSPFSLGVMVSSISVQSTDENWRREFRSECDKDYKMMDVVDFSIYWDSEVLGELEGDSLVLALQQKKAAVATQQDAMSASMMAGHAPSVDVIVRPTGGRVKLVRNRSREPLRLAEGPRLSLEAHLEQVPVEVREGQWRGLVRSGEETVRRWRRRRWRKWRPLQPVSQDPRGWWQFAAMNVLERVRERNRRCSPQFLLRRAEQNVAYVALYTQHLALGSVLEEGRKMMEEVEREQSYEELAVLRRLVMNHIKTERDLTEAARQRIERESGNQRQPGLMQRWFTGWMSGYQGQQEQPAGEEEEELLEELGYEATISDSAHRDSLLLHLSFTLSQGSLSLLASPSSLPSLGPQPLVSLSFSSLCSSLDIKPRVRGATFELSLGSVCLNDDTDNDSFFPALVRPKGEELPVSAGGGLDAVDRFPDQPGMETALFRLRASLERGKKINLHVHSRPLDVVYCRSTTDKLLCFLRNPWVVGERGVAYGKFGAEFQSHTTAGIRHRLDELLEGERKGNQYQLSVRLDISAPRIILPEDVQNRHTQMVILDLGHVTFGSVSDWSEEQEKTLEQAVLLGNAIAMETEEDEDEEFATPLSSPPGEVESTDGADHTPSLPAETFSRPVGGAEVAAAIAEMASLPAEVGTNPRVERYLLKMTEMQVRVLSSWQQSQQYLLEEFTLSIRLQRCRDPSPDHAHFSLWASVPSLRFHVDEHKVKSLIMCLHPLTPPTSPGHTPSSPLPTQSMYKSALSPETFLQSDPSIDDSIYLSFYEGPPHKTTSLFHDTKPHPLSRQRSCDPIVARERYQRQLQAAMEVIVSVHFSIDNVFLTLSSNERVIADLMVPGVSLALHRRPHDTSLDLTVQDLCVLDRFQTFGPEFELILCSDGKNLLNLSSLSLKQQTPVGGEVGKSHSYPSFAGSEDTVSNSNAATPTFTPIRAHHSEIPSPLSLRPNYDVISPLSDSLTLLSFSYQHLTSLSPDHPAMRDIELGEGAEEWAWPGEGEPEIHKVCVHCTGVDVMANQETIAEIISFCRRALPTQLLDRARGSEGELATGEKTVGEGSINQKPPMPRSLLHIEVGVVFERLGVRLLRRVNRRSPKKGCGRAASSAHLIASLMFHRLSVEAKRSEDTSLLEGRLEGITVGDLTKIGRKYRDILTMGERPQERMEEEEKRRSDSSDDVPQFLRFSVHISPQSVPACAPLSSDVNVSVSVPSIHYTHSVNLVREVETFVSEFQELSRAVIESFSSAAVGVAKGLVNEKSQFAEQLSTSLGPRSMHPSLFHSMGTAPAIETVDVPQDFTPLNHLYVDILVQSPVITLPSCLHDDKCLVAYLGEISVKNSFSHQNLTDSLLTSMVGPLITERETLVIKIDRMSLHATHDAKSRELLVASGGRSSLGRWWKVLEETSIVARINRRVGGRERGGFDDETREAEGEEIDFEIGPELGRRRGEDSREQEKGERHTPMVWVSGAESAPSADVVVTGEICDPLLVFLPKDVFDQIRITLKHGLYKKPSRKRKRQVRDGGPSLSSHHPSRILNSAASSLSSRPKSEQSLKSEAESHQPQTVAFSFSLPRLSLQLKHTIDSKEKDLVYISFEEFRANCSKSEPLLTSVDLALKSIVIEDLIQEKESAYRYILASSTQPFTGISPLRSASAVGLQRLSLSPSHLTHPLLPLSHLMSSTPRVAPSVTTDSPLRSFSPHNNRDETSQTRVRPDTTGGVEHEQTRLSSSETGFMTPKTSFKRPLMTRGPAGQAVKMTVSESSFADASNECEETGSTLKDSGGSHGNNCLGGDAAGLLSMKAMFVDKGHPQFSNKFDSVGGQVEVEFSSASVIINLQTWVLLLDYLGIGIPTPPPSPSSLLFLEEEEEEENEEEVEDYHYKQQNTQKDRNEGRLNSLEKKEGSSEDNVLGSLTPSSHSHSGLVTSPVHLHPSPLSPTASLSASLFSSSWDLPSSSTSSETTPPPLTDSTSETSLRLSATHRAPSLAVNPSCSSHSPKPSPEAERYGSTLSSQIFSNQDTTHSPHPPSSLRFNPSIRDPSTGTTPSFPASHKPSSDPNSLKEPSSTVGVTFEPRASQKQPLLQSDELTSSDSQPVGEGDSVWGVEGKASVDISLKVKSLTVTFNKPEHPLARGVVSELVAKVESRRGNLQLSGVLGQASVVDLTETGAYYRERFTTTGDPALSFKIFKYGRPDRLMERPFDLSARLDLGSVRYLHTMRFLKEVLAFCSHFPQLIDALQRMKAMAQGNLEYDGPDRKARISLDVDLTGPILLIPKHAFSPEMMAGEFGHVKVTNSTRHDGEEGTLTHMNQSSKTDYDSSQATPITEGSGLFPQATPTKSSLSESKLVPPVSSTDVLDTEGDRQRVEQRLKARSGPCLLDCIKLELTEVDVFSALKVPLHGDKFKIVRQRGKVLKEKGELTLYVERNLFEDFCKDVPDLHIEGTLSAIHVVLDKTQLELVKGLLAMNLGETMEDFEKPSSVIRDPIAPPVAAKVWTNFLFRIRFLGVQLELLQQRQTEVPGSLELSLALFDIQDSEFLFQSDSNQTRTVDFINRAVFGHDTRYSGFDDGAKPNVFSDVLRPRFKTTDDRPIQVQIHVKVSPAHIGATILLNKLRLIALFDLLLLLKSFVFDSIPEDLEIDVDEVDFTPEPYLTPGRSDSPLKPWKRPPPVATPQPNKPAREIRVRLSITETDIVVVEDLSSFSSNAVVLKGTLLLKFQSLPHKLIYTSIEGLELFSCNLDNEDESALSILDPVTITMEIKPPNERGTLTAQGVQKEKSAKKEDRAGEGTMQPFEVEFKQLSVRLSYNDLKMFLAIAQTLPPLTSDPSAPPTPSGNKVDNVLVRQLLPLGYSKSEIRHQLLLSSSSSHREEASPGRQGEEEEREEGEERTGGNIEATDAEIEENGKKFSIGRIELSVAETMNVCLIDDSADRDVPLLDLSLSQVKGIHNPWRRRGEATAVVASDYYNRHISAWEPILEPWRLTLIWEKEAQYSTDLDTSKPQGRMYLRLTSAERLCVNVTSSLIQILKVTQSSWRQDLQQRLREGGGSIQLEEVKLRTHRRMGSGRSHDQSHDSSPISSRMERGLALLHSVRLVSETRQRSKFIPFLLRNSTGLRLQFSTLTSVPSQVYVSPMSVYQRMQDTSSVGVARGVGGAIQWVWVEPGAEQAFDFSAHSKRRHQETRSLVVHQLLVRVAGWGQIDIPVSVDKIGVFFREVRLSQKRRSSPRWLVFAISLSDTRKIINIRSSLVLHNTTELPLDVRLERPVSSTQLPSSSSLTSDRTTSSRPETVDLPLLPARGYTAIPLHLTEWGLKVRPHGWGTQYCAKNLVWRHASGRSPTSHVRTCERIGEGDNMPFRFCVSVQRGNFPLDPSLPPLPAHTLTILPPLTICDLLPCDLQLYLNHTRSLSKMVRRGREISIYFVHTEEPVELNVSLEGFNHCEGCTVSLSTVGVVQGMIVRDARGRPLRLTVTTEVLGGSALKVGISCAYWLVNRTGLPLVFKQEGVREEAAGQWAEHERASTTSPLLYSYQEGDALEKCCMRLGREYCEMSGSTKWCSPFRMISDSGAVRLFSHNRDGRPDQEFQIGVEIHRGKGQYQTTRVVTFVARFQLENRTQYCLAYLQRHQLKHQAELGKKLPVLMPKAVVSFHWPRTDLDQLLCLRVLDISSCRWSGGFPLSLDHSFHIHMRGTSGHSIFVRCHVTLKGATHHIVFSDAALFPTPFRLENLSQIGVSYHQLNTAIPPSLLNPGQSVPYAWDDITQPETLCLQVRGSQEERQFELETLGERGTIYYERFFYIAAAATFPGEGRSLLPGNKGGPASELVLDVPQGTAVILQRKDPERRSQLWRMTSSRQLVHISSSARSDRDMVLSLAGRLPPRGQFTSLMVERRRESRENRQTWRFTEDGRLLLDTAQHLCVQSPIEHLSLREGVDVVLGHIAKSNEGGVPYEQQMGRYRHSPGSGKLVVEVISDGPTRLLQIRDRVPKYTHTAPQDDWAVSDYGQVAPLRSSDVDSSGEREEEKEEEEGGGMELDVRNRAEGGGGGYSHPPARMRRRFSLSLEHGVGLSLINSVPEELVFGSVDGVHVQFTSSSHQQCINLTVQNLQMDNQLSTSYPPIVAYPTPLPSGEPISYPVIKIFAERVPHKSPFATVFKEVEVKVRDITLLLEERLLFKLLQWAGLGGKGAWSGASSSSEEEEEMMKMLSHRSASLSGEEGESQQLYIEKFFISETELRVSMHTTSQLPEDLLRIKKRLGLPLVKFESPISLSSFQQSHILDSPSAFTDALTKHYKRDVHSQALMILGSVDFLGNPVGLVSDVASGVAGMIDSQDVVGLVRDVTHGMSDTTSKLTGTVSHVLGQATFDTSFQEERELVQEQCQTSGDHLKAGIIGLGSGVFGGMTSIFTQPYRGAMESGVGGFLTGVGKGLLGTVAKPVAGIFDLASGTTAALRETMSRVSRLHPPPVRYQRCCIGSTGTLTCYSERQARGQEYLHRLTEGARDERLVSYELLNESFSDLLRLLISSESLYFFRDSPPDPHSLTERIDLCDLRECRATSAKTTISAHHIVLSLVDPYKENSDGRRPVTRFKCSDEKKAREVAQLINYAKNLHEEEKRIVRTLRLQQDTIW